MVSVLLSASAERCFVSRMRDFFKHSLGKISFDIATLLKSFFLNKTSTSHFIPGFCLHPDEADTFIPAPYKIWTLSEKSAIASEQHPWPHLTEITGLLADCGEIDLRWREGGRLCCQTLIICWALEPGEMKDVKHKVMIAFGRRKS